MFNKDTYINRRNKLRESMKEGIALILGNVDSPMNCSANILHFRQDSSFLYFFGLDHPGFAGVLDIDNNKDYIFANDVDIDDIIWMGPQPLIKDMAAEVGVENTAPFADLTTFIQNAIKEGKKIHFLPPYRAENKMLLEQLTGIKSFDVKENFSLDLVNAIIDIRSVKEPQEIAEIEKACNIGYEMHTTAMKMAKPGVCEKEIAGAIEGIALSKGNMLSFPVILSMNGQTLHNHDHSNILEEGRLMLTDAGAETVLHYASDYTRTVPVGGKFTEKQKEIYNIVLAANEAAIAAIKPGVPYRDIHLISAKVITEGLMKLGLMKGDADEAVKAGAHALFFPHGLGHMLGLDVHDMEDFNETNVGYDDEIKRSTQFGLAFLRLGRRLQEGFVLTTEPGIYFIPELIDKWQNEGTNTEFINFDKVNEYRNFGGIRLEDDILVTAEGGKILGDKRIPITVEEVEAFMAEN